MKYSSRLNREKIWNAYHALPERAHPLHINVTLREEEVETHRFLRCLHYAKCLDLAAACAWESFVCTECPIFLEYNEQATKDPNNHLREAIAELEEIIKQRKEKEE